MRAGEEVAPGDEREALVAVRVCPLRLSRIDLTDIVARRQPGGFERFAQHILDPGLFLRIERLEGGAGAVKVEQLLAAHREQRAALQYLNLDTLLEHVGGRRHGDVCRACLGQKLSGGKGQAGFDG